MTDKYIDRQLNMKEKFQIENERAQALEIPQGEAIRQIPKGTIILSSMSPGSCVLGIALTENGFTATHAQQGEIVRELTALAKLGDKVTVYQGLIEGEIGALHANGTQLNPTQVKIAFKNRDRRHLTGLT